jgi:prepilin-type N-terminal cleavage/methylation domain-containing protein
MKFSSRSSMKYSVNAGFTLIELMIASAVFITIVTAGITVLITATNNYRSTSQIRQSLDTLNFAMEDMTRNVRLGYHFHCPSFFTNIESESSCPTPSTGTYGLMGSSLIGFEAYDGNSNNYPDDQVVYWMQGGKLYKKSKDSLGSIGISTNPANSPLFSQITPDGVVLDMVKSGFTVSSIQYNTNQTPAVTMRLAGTVAYNNTTIPFDIQSTMAPRNRPNGGQ